MADRRAFHRKGTAMGAKGKKQEWAGHVPDLHDVDTVGAAIAQQWNCRLLFEIEMAGGTGKVIARAQYIGSGSDIGRIKAQALETFPAMSTKPIVTRMFQCAYDVYMQLDREALGVFGDREPTLDGTVFASIANRARGK